MPVEFQETKPLGQLGAYLIQALYLDQVLRYQNSTTARMDLP